MLKEIVSRWIWCWQYLVGQSDNRIPPEGYGWVVYDENNEPVQAYNCTEQDLYMFQED